MNSTIVAIAGASGAGKSVLLNYVQGRYGFRRVMNITTCPDEKKKDFGHVSNESFRSLLSNGKLVWQRTIGDDFYGMRLSDLRKGLQGEGCVMEVPHYRCFERLYEVALAEGVSKENLLFFHILSPGREVLEKRLRDRGDSPDSIQQRMAEAGYYDAKMRRLELPVPVHTLRNDSTVKSLFLQAAKCLSMETV